MKYFVRRSVAGLVIVLTGLVLFAVVVVVAVPARALFNNLLRSSDADLAEVGLGSRLTRPSDAGEWQKYSLRPGGSSPIPGPEHDSGERPARLTIELNSIDPASGTASLNLSLDAKSAVMAGDGAIAWPTKYQNQTGALTVGENTIELPLDRLSTEEFTQTVQVRTYSNPSRYPSDWYRLAIGEVVIALPEDESLRHNGLPFLPVAVQLKAAPSMEGKSIEFTIEHPLMTNNFAEVRSDEIEDVQIVVKRESTARFFVWAMALAPVLLIFAAGTQVASSIRHRDNIEPQSVLPLGLGVAVLAILPLRQVLVPSDVQGLTTVDFLLGTELALLIALVAVSTLFRYARAEAASTRKDMGEGAT